MSVLKSNLLLLLAAAIWGLGFVAQKVGMDYIGPFTFTGIRFALGALSLVPLLLFYNRGSQKADPANGEGKQVVRAGILLGLVLFIAATLQQIGLIYTTAGKSAFITCLYIVLVPMVGIFFKQYIPSSTWVGCIMAIVGLYLICVKENFNISYGEGLQLVATLLWTMHILLVDHFSKQVDVLKLSFIQFITCSALSLLTALFFETINMQAFSESLVSLLYGGVCSVGIAFTLQIIGQKHAEPSHAAIIFSMETVFAAVGGWVILGENLGIRESWGCGIMLVGMLLSQLQNVAKNENEEKHIQGIPG